MSLPPSARTPGSPKLLRRPPGARRPSQPTKADRGPGDARSPPARNPGLVRRPHPPPAADARASPRPPRPPGARARPAAAGTRTSPASCRRGRRVPAQPAPHCRAAAAGASASGDDLHETLPYWLSPPHLTLAPYAHVENCCGRSAYTSLPVPPPEGAEPKLAEAEVRRRRRRLSARPIPAQAQWLGRPRVAARRQ